ncbi:MAG: prephenate dehydrogenase [Verrucomicrobiia bacterium]
MQFNKVAILGAGLLGSSLALAMKRHRLAKNIVLWTRRSEIIAQLHSKQIGDSATTDIQEAVTSAQLVIFSTPIGIMPTLAQTCLPYVTLDTLITDVGSVKASVVETLEKIFDSHALFVGSHPMAGSDKTGFEHATETLFDDAACFITPTQKTSPTAQQKITEFWTILGCRIKILLPDHHDQLVAAISHLPHLLASLLVNTVTSHHTADALEWVGGGFRDGTRVALGSPNMWNEILSQNRNAILKAIQNFRHHLDQTEHLLQQNQSLEKSLEEAANARKQIMRK